MVLMAHSRGGRCLCGKLWEYLAVQVSIVLNTATHIVSQKNYISCCTITVADVDQFSRFFYHKILKEMFCMQL